MAENRQSRRTFNPLSLYSHKTDLDRILVVNEIPSEVEETDLKIYLEDICRCKVTDFYFHDGVSEVALVKLDKPIEDLAKCQKKSSRRKIERQTIFIEPVFRPEGIVITDLPSDLDLSSLDSYFRSRESGVRSGSSPSLDVYSDIAVVCFKNPSKVLANVLGRRHYPFGHAISVEPYYQNFHDKVLRYLYGGSYRRSVSSNSDAASSLDDSDDGTSHDVYSYCDESTENKSDHSLSPVSCDRSGSSSSDSEESDDKDQSLRNVSRKQSDCKSVSSSSSENERQAVNGEEKSRKKIRAGRGSRKDCPYSVKLEMNKICEDGEDEKLVANIFQSPLGKTFTDSLETRYSCSIDIEYIQEVVSRRRGYRPTSSSTNVSPPSTSVSPAAAALGRNNSNNSKIRHQNQVRIACGRTKAMTLNDLLVRSMLGGVVDSDDDFDTAFSTPQLRPRPQRNPTYRKWSTTVGNSTITVKTGDITKEKADVLVNVIGDDLNYNGNRISSCFVHAGGHSLTRMLDIQKARHSGNVIIKTGSGSLPCNKLYTMVLGSYTDQRSEKKYREAVDKCLKEGMVDKIQSIAMPVIGCGQAFKYSRKFVSETLASQVIQTANDPLNQSITDFTIVSFDENMYKELEAVLKTQSTSSAQGATASNTSNGNDSPKVTRRETEKTTVGCKIVVNGRKSNLNHIKTKIEDKIKEELLHERSVENSSSSCLPFRVRGHVYDRAKKAKFVRVIDNGTGQIRLRGHKETVVSMKSDIVSIVEKPSPLKMGDAVSCPPHFWNILAHEPPLSPPYWTKFHPNTELKQLFRNNTSRKRFQTVEVDKTTFNAIRTLVQKTWKEEFVGQGKDAVNLSHQNIKVKKVERIENLDVFNKYSLKRQEQFRMLADDKQEKLHSLGQLNVKTKGDILTNKFLPPILKQDLFPEINEYYFFHGTKPDVLPTAIRTGLDCRLSSDKSMLGTGIYGAESSTKADQYSDSKTKRTPGDKQMLLVRMLLGKMYVCSDSNPPKYRRPPCMNGKCRKDDCIGGHELFDSVIGDGQWLFREFVVYSPDQCYPEYLITYERE